MKRILVIDDEPPLRKILVSRLKEEKYEVIEAEDGKNGLETALKFRPDLIMLDIDMPKMDGLSLADALKHDDWGKSAEIIYLTNINPNDKMMKHLSKEELSRYLIKANWSLDDVVVRVNKILNKA